MIRRAFDRVSLAWYRWRIRRVLRRKGDADDYPLFIGLVFLTLTNVAIPACAHRNAMRAVDAIHARCLREIDHAATEAEVDATQRQCERDLREVGR